MSDFSSIPGTGKSKYGTADLIAGLMKLERIPRDRAQADLDSLQKKQAVWVDLGRNVSSLRDAARSLYSFRNPFSDRIAKSDDEDILTATATREALEQTRRIEVERVAAADRFISNNLPKDYKVPAGTYTFTIGEKKIELSYSGGTLQDFADALARKGKDWIGASTVSVTADTKALVIESLKTGAKNRLGFSGDAEKLALDAGLVEKTRSKAQTLDLAKPLPWALPLDPSTVKGSGASLQVAPGGEARLALAQTAPTSSLVLEVQYRLTRPEETPAPAEPPGPAISASGSINYEGITILGAPSDSGLPGWTPPAAKPKVDDPVLLYALGPGGAGATPVALPALADSKETATLTVPLGSLLPELGGLGIRDRDSARRLELVSVRVYDPSETGGLRPRKPISTAADSLFKVDGVEASRDSNEIKDMIPGVTLQLKEVSDKAVKLSVEPDRKAAKEAVIALVGNYNKLMAWMNILSRNDPSIIAGLDYFTDAEKKTANERLGLYQGDSTLSFLRANLQKAIMDPYETRLGPDLALMSQIGVSTDSRKPGSGQGVDSSRLKGYLEIDEEGLDKALAANFAAVRDLFGNDTDGDLIVNTGVAYALDAAARPYVEVGGIFTTKRQTIEGQITSEKRTIATLDEALIAKEADLKRKYGMMEGALNSMEGTSNSIDNFTKNNSGG